MLASRSVLGAMLLVVTASQASIDVGDPQVNSGAFRALFERYRFAGADEAVDEFSRWDAERIKREATPPADVQDSKTLAALALLYTEAGIRNGRFGLPAETVSLAPADGWRRLEEWRRLPWPSGDSEKQKDILLGPPSVNRRVMSLDDFDVHSRTALFLVRDLVRRGSQGDAALLDFCRSWYIVAVSLVPPFRPGHMPLRRAALVDFGDDPEMLLLVGSYGFGRPAQEATFRRTLALDPLLVEARVRLGRLLHQLGRGEEAGRELQRAVRDAHDTHNSVMEDLALLFLGRLHEDDRRMEEAAKYYRAASAVNPNWHAADVALGILRVAGGNTDDGWAAGRRTIEDPIAPVPPVLDPWYLYGRAQYWQMEQRIQSMRAMVRP